MAAAKKTPLAGKEAAVFRSNTGFEEQNTVIEETNPAVEGKLTTVFAAETMFFEQENMVSRRDTLVFVLETADFASATTAEETPTLVSAAQSGVTRKTAMVFAGESGVEGKNALVAVVESAVEELKTGQRKKNRPLSLPHIAVFSLGNSVFILPTGTRARPTGTRISLFPVCRMETVVASIKTGASALDTGSIAAETGTCHRDRAVSIPETTTLVACEGRNSATQPEPGEMDDVDENRMPTVAARLAKPAAEQGADTAIIAALIDKGQTGLPYCPCCSPFSLTTQRT